MEKYYTPAEDTFLLLNEINKELKILNKNKKSNNKNNENKKEKNKKNKIKICEIGIGSGYISINIAKKFSDNLFFGSDINKEAIKNTKKEFKKINSKIILKNKNLFEGFKKIKFDLIIFNTPYLPCETNEKYSELNILDKAIYGGKNGNEIIKEFIFNLNDNLKNEGSAIILYSSLSKPKEIEKILTENQFSFEIIKKENHFFEELIIIKINKNNILKEISKNNINKIKYLASGKHSIVLEGKIKNKKVIIKIGKEEHIKKETFFLKKLKKEKFLGHLIFSSKEFVIKEKVEGTIIKEFLENCKNKNKILKILENTLNVCFKLDKLKINKFEMTNPYKHIFIQKNLEIKMIDFERSIFSTHPKNTTQFLQYILRNKPLLKEKGINLNKNKILNVAKKYKSDWKKFKINKILD